MDGIWIVYLFLAAFPGLIIFAAIYKYMEVAAAARWPSTPGRVVVSKSEVREVKTGVGDESDSEPRNFAKIVYEYTVADRTYRCDRVSIGENLGNFEVAETIARYPVGKPVTVYYNPAKRSEAVLERDVPPGIWKGLIILLLVIAGLILVPIVGYNALRDALAPLVRDASEAPFVAACIGFALLAALVIQGIQRNLMRMRRWPTVPGHIRTADVRAYEARSDAGERLRTQYRPDVTYGYRVAGVDYTGNQVGTTARVSSNIDVLVKPGGRYAPGSAVNIHYNPDNPAELILDPRPGPLWLLWLIPAAMFALAYVVGR